MITQHQYIDQHPIKPNSERLILGTIHPHNHEKFDLQFFYGNKCTIWNLLHEAFPDEITDPRSLPEILKFLQDRKTAISDVIKSCRRIDINSPLDQDLEPIEYNETLLDIIRHSNIKEILFTSGFGKNAAFRIFYTILLKKTITTEIRKNKGILLDSSIFGRPVQLRVLYSPSGSANRGLKRSAAYIKNQSKYSGFPNPIQAFKIDHYRDSFGATL